jgi:hypothetical protein
MRALVDAPGVPAPAMATAARETAGADASDTVQPIAGGPHAGAADRLR